MIHTTILVTGATGNVGREIVKQLSMQNGNIRVRAGVHSLIKGENLKRLPDVEIVEMDFSDRESLHAAFTHADKVMMVTPLAEEQVQMAKNLVDEAKKAGVKHLVRLSVYGADTEPGIQLTKWHREVEKYIEDSGLAYTFIRPTAYMQNFVNYEAESIKGTGKFYQPTADAKIAYIDTRDIASVAVEVLTGEGHEGKAYDVTGPDVLTNTEVAEIMSEVTGKKIEFVNVPDNAAERAMKEYGMSDKLVMSLMELYTTYKEGPTVEVNDDIKHITGREPHSFKQFMTDYRECFM